MSAPARSETIAVDLTGPRWDVALTRADAAPGRDPLEMTRAFSHEPASWLGQGLLEYADEPLILRADRRLERPEPAASEALAQRLAAERLGYAARIGPSLSATATPTAVAFPYRTPPLLRRQLPALFGHDPIRPRGGWRSEGILFGVEAPVALALEAVARDACTPPAHLILLTGAGAGREVTAVALEAEAPGPGRPALRVEVSFSAPWSPDVLPALRAAIGRDEHASSLRIVLAADAPADEVAGLADALGLGPDRIVPLGEHAVALGAARFAGLCRDKALLGKGLRRVQVVPVCPSPLGVVGVNRRGAWFWYRLAPAGTPLPTPWAVVHSDAPGPETRRYLAIAEASRPSASGRRWLPESEWEEAGLTWHETVKATPSTRRLSATPGHEWAFRLEPNPDDPWSLPRWAVNYSPAPTTP